MHHLKVDLTTSDKMPKNDLNKWNLFFSNNKKSKGTYF